LGSIQIDTESLFYVIKEFERRERGYMFIYLYNNSDGDCK